MRTYLVLALLATSVACSPETQEATNDPGTVNAAAEAFLDYNHAFDYAAMRANATADFEIIIFGQRMDMDGFEELLRRMEESRQGRPLGSYELMDLHTTIVGDVAYTSWASPTRLEGAIFVRSGDRWLMDRAFSVPVAGPDGGE